MHTPCSTKSETGCPWLARLKPYDSQETFLQFLTNHYALMAMNAGTIDHARYMTRQYQKHFPTLSILIAKQIKELNDSSCNFHS
jgi:hypothetical protein